MANSQQQPACRTATSLVPVRLQAQPSYPLARAAARPRLSNVNADGLTHGCCGSKRGSLESVEEAGKASEGSPHDVVGLTYQSWSRRGCEAAASEEGKKPQEHLAVEAFECSHTEAFTKRRIPSETQTSNSVHDAGKTPALTRCSHASASQNGSEPTNLGPLDGRLCLKKLLQTPLTTKIRRFPIEGS